MTYTEPVGTADTSLSQPYAVLMTYTEPVGTADTSLKPCGPNCGCEEFASSLGYVYETEEELAAFVDGFGEGLDAAAEVAASAQADLADESEEDDLTLVAEALVQLIGEVGNVVSNFEAFVNVVQRIVENVNNNFDVFGEVINELGAEADDLKATVDADAVYVDALNARLTAIEDTTLFLTGSDDLREFSVKV